MTEQDFIETAKKRGVSEENINSTLKIFYEMNTINSNVTLEQYLEIVVQVQNRIDNDPNDSVSVD